MGGTPDVSIISTDDGRGEDQLDQEDRAGSGGSSSSGTSIGGRRSYVGANPFGRTGAGRAGGPGSSDSGSGSSIEGITGAVSSGVRDAVRNAGVGNVGGGGSSGFSRGSVQPFSDDVELYGGYAYTIPLVKNYDAFYLNPDLENLLNTRGFSTKRPEIIGMFNYEAPLSKGATDGTGAEFLINTAGELYDYQCQLKQLRYRDAALFFSQRVGVKLSSSGELFATDSFGTEVIERYKGEMNTAKVVLDYLTEIYNGVTKFINAQGLSHVKFDISDRTMPNSSDYPTPLSKAVIMQTPVFTTDPSAGPLPAIDLSDPVLFMHFLRIVTGQAIGSGGSIMSPDSFTDFGIPDEYGADLPSRLVSGTYGLITMLNFIAGCIYGISAYPMSSASQRNDGGEFNPAQDFGSKLPGYSRFTLGNSYSFFDNRFTVKAMLSSNSLPMMRKDGEDFTYSNYLGSNLTNWAAATHLTPSISVDGGTADILYSIGLDCIQGAQFDDASSIAGISTDRGGTGDRVGKFLFDLLGRDGYNSQETILDNLPPESSNSITRNIITPNDDEDSDLRTAVESFTSTNFLLAEGTSQSRSGRSYYCDEIVTNEIAESTQRLDSLYGNMVDMGTRMALLTQLYFRKRGAVRSGFSRYFKSLSYDNESYIKPSDLNKYLVRAIRNSYGSLLSEGATATSTVRDRHHMLATLIAAAAAQDDEIMYYVSQYNIAYYYYQNRSESDLNTTETSDTFRWTRDYLGSLIINKSIDIIIERSASEDIGDGTWALYQNAPSQPDGEQAAAQIFDHSDYDGIVGTSSSFHYFPKSGSGTSIDTDGEWDWPFAFGNYSTGRSKLVEALGKGLIDSVQEFNNILLAPYRALCEFEKDLNRINDNDEKSLQGNTVRGIDSSAKLQGLLIAWRQYIQKSCTAALYVQKERVSRPAGDSKHDYHVTTTHFYALYAFNMRGICSFIDFADIVTNGASALNNKTRNINIHTLKDQDGNSLNQIDNYMAQDDYRNATGNYGYYETIQDLFNSYKKINESVIAREIYFIKACTLMAHAADRINQPVLNLVDIIRTNNAAQSLYDDALAQIKSDPKFQNAALLSITRDQLSLNRALYDSFSVPNREYNYLPASKAIMVEQTKNLSGYLKEPDLLDNESSFRRFIATVGIPAGSIENLRNRMMDQTGNIEYRHSTLVEIAIWKRDLLHEDRVYRPKRFLFDTSRMMIYGRPIGTEYGSELLDDSIVAASPQHFKTVEDNAVYRKYTPNGNTYTRKGHAYSHNFSSESQEVYTDELNRNLLVDYYLKLFMRLTTGIDVSEDVFPFLEGNVFFKDVDPNLMPAYEEMAERLKTQFVDFSSIESSLNYDRLLGEIRRSIYMSPQKYRNRIIYPKVFERTFCILLDPESFELAPMTEKKDAERTDLVVDMGTYTFEGTASSVYVHPTYSQYYATISLKPPFEASEKAIILFDNDGQRREYIISAVRGVRTPTTEES